ncbi:MAG: hypothetical protein ACX94A_00085 [Algiphilus sp.]
MTDTVFATLITVGGMTTVAIISVISQFFVTRLVIRAENNKKQVEHAVRRFETKAELLTTTLAELLGETDLQVKAPFSYSHVVTLIHRAQLLLDRTDDSDAELCRSTNQLGLQLKKYIPHHHKPVEQRLDELKQLLGVHSKVADLAGQLVQSRGGEI